MRLTSIRGIASMCALVFATMAVSSHTVLAQAYIWPTDAGRVLTSSFGEYRPGHFHAGIDVKTWGNTGYQVFAIAPGTVMQIRTSPFGYGRVVYIRHDNGYTSVYAHLSRFSETLETLIRKAQKQRGRYAVNKWLKPGEMRVEAGELIGFTGRSGTRHPHLHFEVRDEKNRPFNPLSLGFPVEDSVRPVPVSVAVSPLTVQSHVAGDFLPKLYSLTRKGPGLYRMNETVYGWGELGFAINAYDRANGGSNKFAVQTIRLYIDDMMIFSADYDWFSFENTHLIDLDRDFRLNNWGAGLFQKLYVEDGNTLPFYTAESNGGKINSLDPDPEYSEAYSASMARVSTHSPGMTAYGPGEHLVKIACLDFHGNTTEIDGVLHLMPVNAFVSRRWSGRKPSFEAFTGTKNDMEMESRLIDDVIRFSVKSGRAGVDAPCLMLSVNYLDRQPVVLNPVSEAEFAGQYQWPGMKEGTIIATVRQSPAGTGHEIAADTLRLFAVTVMDGGVIISDDGTARLSISPGTVCRPVIASARVHPFTHESAVLTRTFEFYPADFFTRRSAELSIHVPGGKERWKGCGIYYVGESGVSPAGGVWKEDRLTARVGGPATFAVLQDTVGPELISITPRDNSTISTGRLRVAVEFRDALSGINGEDCYQVFVDGKRLIMEYDPVYDTAHHRFEETLEAGSHALNVILQDAVGNETTWSGVFEISRRGHQ